MKAVQNAAGELNDSKVEILNGLMHSELSALALPEGEVKCDGPLTSASAPKLGGPSAGTAAPSANYDYKSLIEGGHAMTCYFSKTLEVPFAQAVDKTTAALKEHGFGVLTRIDVQSTLKEKIGADFHPYVILGACNPKMAHQALQAEDKIGTMLPCNVIVQEIGGRTEVAAVDPVASMQAIENEKLASVASKVREELRAVVQSL